MIKDGKEVAVTSHDKAEVIARTLAKVHSSDNLRQEEKEGREDTILRHADVNISDDQVGGRRDATS